jgi:hypothetical protein
VTAEYCTVSDIRGNSPFVAARFLERMTWPEVQEAIDRGVDAVLLPIGTTEQHGHHMPLDTDCFIARSLWARAAEAGEAEGVALIVAPTLNVTPSWYHTVGGRRRRDARDGRAGQADGRGRRAENRPGL